MLGAVAVEMMEFNPDGTIRHVEQTAAGVSVQLAN